MARGETRGERRRRRRRERGTRSGRPLRSPATDAQEFQGALDARPAWVKAIWATGARRLALSIAFLSVAAWILISAFSDPDAFFENRRAAAGFVAAPLLVLMFGLQAVEAVGDLVLRTRDSVPVFHRLGRWLDRRGLYLLALYLVVMVGVLVALID